MSLNQSVLSTKLETSVARSNQTLTSVVDQLKGLTLNKFCLNRWVYHQGTCYYFSKAQVLPHVPSSSCSLLSNLRRRPPGQRLMSSVACCTPQPASRCQNQRRPTSSWPRSTPTSPSLGTLSMLTCETYFFEKKFFLFCELIKGG